MTNGQKLLISIAVMPIMVVYAAYRAFVIVTIWRWFLEPQYDIAAPSVISVMAALLVWAMLTFRQKDQNDDWEERMWFAMLTSPIITTVTLGFAYLYSLFL